MAGLLGSGSLSCSPEAPSSIPGEDGHPEGQDVAFTDVTSDAGLGAFRHAHGGIGQAWAPEIVGAGAAFLDVDGDGWLDILLVGGGSLQASETAAAPALWLYQNQGDGTFALTTEAAGLGGLAAYGLGLVAADHDNDGDTDVVLTCVGENRFFRNNGGVFVEVRKDVGLADDALWSTSALFFDADRDGWVDLFVGNYVDWSLEKDLYCTFEGEKVYCTPEGYQGVASRFYRNDRGRFVDRTQEAGIADGIAPTLDKTLGVAELDYNNDGWPDLIVANDTERDLLYENNGDGTFREKGVSSGVAFDRHGKPRAGMGVDVGVLDSTGQATIIVGNFSDEMAGVYRHTGGGLFTDRAAASRIGHPSLRTLTFGLFLFDVDLDTDLDLLAANGHVQTHVERMLEGITYRQPVQLYLNHGDGTFALHQPEAASVLGRPLVARGAAYGDYDRDGDLDVLVTENNGPVHLWRNDLAGKRFLRVQLEGRTSNRDGIGSRVVASVGALRMERRIRTGSSYLSQSELTATFGLGNVAKVDTLWVYWPSGTVDRFLDVPANRELRILEGDETFEEVSLTRQPSGV